MELMLNLIQNIQPGHVFAIIFAKLVFDFIKGIFEKRSSESKMILDDIREVKESIAKIGTDVTAIKTVILRGKEE